MVAPKGICSALRQSVAASWLAWIAVRRGRCDRQPMLLPARPNMPHPLLCPWIAVPVSPLLALAALGCPVAAQAQDAAPAQTEAVVPVTGDPDRQVQFEADGASYDERTATGQRLWLMSCCARATSRSGPTRSPGTARPELFWQEGNIRLCRQADGNQLFSDKIELTDELRKPGRWSNMLLALREGGRLAANKGERDGGRQRHPARNAVYSACAVEDSARLPAQSQLADQRRAGDFRSRQEAGPIQGPAAGTVRRAAVAAARAGAGDRRAADQRLPDPRRPAVGLQRGGVFGPPGTSACPTTATWRSPATSIPRRCRWFRPSTAR
jgi:hypothetical protein